MLKKGRQPLFRTVQGKGSDLERFISHSSLRLPVKHYQIYLFFNCPPKKRTHARIPYKTVHGSLYCCSGVEGHSTGEYSRK